MVVLKGWEFSREVVCMVEKSGRKGVLGYISVILGIWIMEGKKKIVGKEKEKMLNKWFVNVIIDCERKIK